MEASEVIKQQKTEIYNLKAKIKELENKTSKPIAGDKVEQLVEAIMKTFKSDAQLSFFDMNFRNAKYSTSGFYSFLEILIKQALTSFTSQSHEVKWRVGDYYIRRRIRF